jgi:Dullard-like phosphatase family protein
MDFLVETNNNRLVRKIIKVLISCNTLILILLTQTDYNFSTKFIITNDIFYQLSNILYNIFEHFVLSDLDKNKNDLNMILRYKNIIEKYIIKIPNKKNNNIDILPILIQKTDKCLKTFNNKIEELKKDQKIINLVPAFESILSMLNCINLNTILKYNEITRKVILFSILELGKHKLGLYSFRFTNKLNNEPPYLPPIDPIYKYTLVLDMDETLIHFLYKDKEKNNIIKFNSFEANDILQLGMFLLRPFIFEFFEELKNLYEIIIFTNGTKEYCDRILELIDPNHCYIKYRLYRKHSILKNKNIYLKDLSLLGRDIDKIIIVDNLEQNYELQKDNGIPITSWKGDINDTALKNLIPILKLIVQKKVDDVRKIIVKMKNSSIKQNENNYINVYNQEILN